MNFFRKLFSRKIEKLNNETLYQKYDREWREEIIRQHGDILHYLRQYFILNSNNAIIRAKPGVDQQTIDEIANNLKNILGCWNNTIHLTKELQDERDRLDTKIKDFLDRAEAAGYEPTYFTRR